MFRSKSIVSAACCSYALQHRVRSPQEYIEGSLQQMPANMDMVITLRDLCKLVYLTEESLKSTKDN